jgi:hypothetical protein
MILKIMPVTRWCLLVISIVFVFACEEFQTKSYSMTDKDSKACTMLTDTTFQVRTVARLSDYNPEWKNDQISEIAGEVINAMADDSIFVSESELSYLLRTGEGMDTAYVLLESPVNSVILYFDQSLDQDLISTEGIFLSAADSGIPLETIGGCTIVEKDVHKTVIQKRIVYNLSQNRYLIQLIKIDQTAENNIRLSILSN